MPTTVVANGQPFVIQPRLTRIAMAFSQPGMIADAVCPRVNTMGELFQYTKVSLKELISVPDTKIGRTGAANQVEFSQFDETDRTEDHGIEVPVPVKDIDNAAQANAADPLANATLQGQELMTLAREKRVATLINTAGNYANGYKLTLDGTSGKYHFDDVTNGTPVAQMQDARDGMVIRPNTIVMDQPTWTKISRHPETVAKVLPTAISTKGQVTIAQFAELMEVDQMLIGQAWYDTAKKGQTEVPARIWGNFLAMLHINRALNGTQTVMPTFCFSATWEGLQVGTYFDPKRGVKGVQVVKVVDQIKELISWQTAGYLFTSPRTP
jgi:hypothetical protein